MIVVFVVDTSPSMAAAANSSGGDRGTGVIGKHIFFMLKYVYVYLYLCMLSISMYVIYIYVCYLSYDIHYNVLFFFYTIFLTDKC